MQIQLILEKVGVLVFFFNFDTLQNNNSRYALDQFNFSYALCITEFLIFRAVTKGMGHGGVTPGWNPCMLRRRSPAWNCPLDRRTGVRLSLF